MKENVRLVIGEELEIPGKLLVIHLHYVLKVLYIASFFFQKA
jgi:hypothetical protein